MSAARRTWRMFLAGPGKRAALPLRASTVETSCVELARLLSCAGREFADQIFISVAEHVGIGLIQLEIDLIQVAEDSDDNVILGLFRAAKLGRPQVEVFEQLVEIVLARRSHGGLFDIVEDASQIIENETACATWMRRAWQSRRRVPKASGSANSGASCILTLGHRCKVG